MCGKYAISMTCNESARLCSLSIGNFCVRAVVIFCVFVRIENIQTNRKYFRFKFNLHLASIAKISAKFVQSTTKRSVMLTEWLLNINHDTFYLILYHFVWTHFLLFWSFLLKVSELGTSSMPKTKLFHFVVVLVVNIPNCPSTREYSRSKELS